MLEVELKALGSSEILNVRDIVAWFRVDGETVYNWKKKGMLKMQKIGGRYYARREDVEKLLWGE